MQQVIYRKEKALEISEFGRDVAAAIDDAIFSEAPADFTELTFLAERIRHCNNDKNNWVAEDLHTDDGECYSGNGRFWNCGSKMCPHCIAKQSRNARRKLRKILKEQKLLVGENLHFLTLTMPNQGIDLLAAREIINYAWSMFRKKKWFTDTIFGGFKSEEFVLTKTGYHYHLHQIVRSKYIDYKKFRQCWTECLHSAVAETAIEFQINTSDGLAMANCQRITNIDEAVLEVAKYITKTSTWSKIPPSDLLEICRVRRFPRMFEFFGCFRLPSEIEPSAEDEDLYSETILDTKVLSDGEKLISWRDELAFVGPRDYLMILEVQIEKCIEVRRFKLKQRYPYAKFWQLSGAEVRPWLAVHERLRTYHMNFEDSPQGQKETQARIALNSAQG